MARKRGPFHKRSLRASYYEAMEDEWLFVQVEAVDGDALFAILDDLSIHHDRIKGCYPWVQFEVSSQALRMLTTMFLEKRFEILD